MKFGICVGDNAGNVALAAQSGFDYVESCFSLLAEAPDEKYDAFAAALKENHIPCLSVNCFIPGRLKVTGPEVDNEALTAYVKKGMERGKAMGVKKVVFGSGGARNIPEGFPYREGYQQIVAFLQNIVSPLAAANDITVVIEPLGREDSNIINGAQEAAAVAAAVGKDNVHTLVDLYHMTTDINDSPDTIKRLTGDIRHSHIACPESRVFPTDPAAYDYKAFVDALIDAGCDTCSIEGRTDDFAADAPAAAKVLKGLL